MSSLDCKTENKDINKPPTECDDNENCRICKKLITNIKPLSGIKSISSKKKKKTIYDVCEECQSKTHNCPKCTEPIKIITYINGHKQCNQKLKKIFENFLSNSTDSEKEEKIKIDLREILKKNSNLEKELEVLKRNLEDEIFMRKLMECKFKREIEKLRKQTMSPQLKLFVNDLIRENVKNRLIYNCNDCRPCIEYYSHKHTCGKCKLCQKCDGKVTIYDDHISLDCSNELNSLE